jgi:tetratricopeptide (TPR) repeat protein
LGPEKRIGRARVKKRVMNNFFISDLDALRLRRPHSAAAKVIPPLTAAAFIDSAILAGHDRLLKYIALGERAHGFRDADALERIGQGILELPLGAQASSVGNYYTALSINRRGPDAYPEANKLLADVVKSAPAAFRAKAMVALGTNLGQRGDRDAARSAFSEARQLAARCGYWGLQPACVIEIQDAVLDYRDGNHRSALGVLRRLSPLIHSISLQYPALLHSYYNNFAIALTKTGQPEEALSLYPVLAASPFLSAYPEWYETCADLEVRMSRASRSLISVGERLPSTSNLLMLPVRSEAALSGGNPEVSGSERSRSGLGRGGARVLRFESQKDRMMRERRNSPIPRPNISADEALRLTFQQKQALALRFVLSDNVTEQELDHIITFALTRPADGKTEP